MASVSGIVLFFLIWWVVIFTTLPFGNRRADQVTTGHAASAPARHNMPRKILATTVITIILWYPLHTAFVNFLDDARTQAYRAADQERPGTP